MSELFVVRTIPEEEARGIANQILGEWWLIANESLFETVSPRKAIEFLRPYMSSAGMKWALWLDKELNLQGDALMRLAQNLKIGPLTANMPCSIEIAKRELVLIFSSCTAPNTRFRSEWCQMHEIFLNGVCEAIAPEYNFRYSQRIFDGHPCCKGGVRETEVPSDQWEDYGDIMAVMLEPPVPEDLMNEGRCGLLRDMWITTVEGFMDATGEKEAMDILEPFMIESGATWGLKFIDLLGLERHEIGLPRLLELVNEIMQLQGETTIRPDRVDEQILSCPFRESSGAICRLFHSFVEGLSCSLAPDMMFTRKQKCPSQPFCHWTFNRTKEKAEG